MRAAIRTRRSRSSLAAGRGRPVIGPAMDTPSEANARFTAFFSEIRDTNQLWALRNRQIPSAAKLVPPRRH